MMGLVRQSTHAMNELRVLQHSMHGTHLGLSASVTWPQNTERTWLVISWGVTATLWRHSCTQSSVFTCGGGDMNEREGRKGYA